MSSPPAAGNPYASEQTRYSAAPAASPRSGQTGRRVSAQAADLTRDRVVTGEAVALELRPASPIRRVMSALLDGMVYLSIAIGVVFVLLRFVVNLAQVGVLQIVVLALLMVILPTTVETVTRGLSAGKLAVGVRIVRDDGGAIRFRHAFIRALTGIMEIWLTLGIVALIASAIHPRGKRLGDMVAGTYSLSVREAEGTLAPLLMPPELRAWAETADIRRLPDAMALYARIYLSRTGMLDPRVRTDIARGFAANLERYVSPPPPWGTDPERFIAAVLVARRDREYLTGMRSDERERHEAQRTRTLPFGISDAP